MNGKTTLACLPPSRTPTSGSAPSKSPPGRSRDSSWSLARSRITGKVYPCRISKMLPVCGAVATLTDTSVDGGNSSTNTS